MTEPETYCPLPAGPFGAILADPPWSFRTWDQKRTVAGRRAADPYRTMSPDAIMALPVAAAALPDSALFLWTIGTHLPQALAVGAAWGFEYKTDVLIWDKGRIGMGYWSRKQCEICLLFTRGKPARLDKGVRQLIVAPRREHSRKPDEQYGRIEALVGGPYLEMFARESRPGWTTWGNEAGKFDRPAYNPALDGIRGYDLAIAAVRLQKIEAGELPPMHDTEAAELRARVYGCTS